MSRTNETRHVKWHETCKCKCRLDASVCNRKQSLNDDECRCESKGMCDNGFVLNPSNCDCKCDKSCDIGEYLDYGNVKCRKRLVDKLIEECTENVHEVTLFECNPFEHKNKSRSSCTIYVALIVIVFTICIGIGTHFSYKHMNHWYLKNDVTRIKFGTRTQTTV